MCEHHHGHCHGHSHEHHHDHDHEHCCGHDHPHGHDGHGAHALLDNALTLSGSWRYPGPVPEERVEDGLRELAALLAEDGAILGHIKALLQCGENGVAFSITRLDAADRTVVGVWPPPGPEGEWSLTVNVLSLVHTGAVTRKMLEELFSSLQ